MLSLLKHGGLTKATQGFYTNRHAELVEAQIQIFLTFIIVKEFGVYILQCNDDSYYTGMTSNIGQRLLEHETGKFPDCYTFDKRPFKLVFYQVFQDFNQAMLFEKKIKGWSRRKKQALIEERWEDLPRLSKNYTEFGKPEDPS